MHSSKILEVLFNKQLCRGRSVIENSFCILKKPLLLKINLHVPFLLDVVVCCWILYNMILGGKDFDIDTSLTQLELEKFVSRTHVHGQRRGGQEETTAQIPSTGVKTVITVFRTLLLLKHLCMKKICFLEGHLLVKAFKKFLPQWEFR